MMFPCVAFFLLSSATNSLSVSLPTGPMHIDRAYGRSAPFPNLDRNTTLAAQAATRLKFRNAPALLAGLGTSHGYTIPPSLQNAYDRASDYATNVTMLSSQPGLSAFLPLASSSAIRLASTETLGSVDVVNVSLLDDTDSVDDFEYYGSLRFGSREQSLEIDFDTGSADLWVPVDCDCGSINSFQANASTTYHDSGETFQVTYGSGFVSGTLAQDTVTVGSLKVSNQSIGAAREVSANFAQSPNDGLAGLAFSTIANSQKPTLFENMVSQSQLAAPLFSFYMTRTQPRGSEVCFGGIDQSKVKGSNISWLQVISKTYWTVGMSGVVVESLIPANISAIVDTGTSFIYIPDTIANAIYEQIPGSSPAPDFGYGFYQYPCNSRESVSFVLGGTTLALNPRDMNIGQYTSSTCVGAIIGASSILDAGDIAILGDSFLKSYVSVFDYSHGARVGLVESIDE